LPELIIYLFAKQIHEVVSTLPYASYEQMQETLLIPHSKINFDRYLTQMPYCNYHFIDCNYELFVFDSSLNRRIKYCTRLLPSKTRTIETQRILNAIIFVDCIVYLRMFLSICLLVSCITIAFPTIFGWILQL